MSSPKSILIVDDTPEIIELLSDYFNENDYAVMTAINGKMAYETLQTNHIDILITDLRMPEVTCQFA